jgi:hypothetical protein
MKTVYCHNREIEEVLNPTSEFILARVSPSGGSTVAMEPVQSWLLDTFQQGDSIQRKVGIARCSIDDNYCKKTGRELAESRMKTTTLTVINIVKHEGRTTVFLEDANDNLFELQKTNDPHCARLVRMLDD